MPKTINLGERYRVVDRSDEDAGLFFEELGVDALGEPRWIDASHNARGDRVALPYGLVLELLHRADQAPDETRPVLPLQIARHSSQG